MQAQGFESGRLGRGHCKLEDDERAVFEYQQVTPYTME
jgi:hypothetical protein